MNDTPSPAPGRVEWRGEIVGHRGAAALAPENTMASFEAAIDCGVNVIELDVRVTADGQAIVFHDAMLDRLCPSLAGARVRDLTLDALMRLEVTGAATRPLPGIRATVPSLDEVIDLVHRRGVGGRAIGLNVEVKGRDDEGLEALAAAIDALERAGEVVPNVTFLLSSFHEEVLAAMRVRAPGLRRAYIVDERTVGDVIATAVEHECEGIHPKATMLREVLALPPVSSDEPAILHGTELLLRARDAGLKVRTWTVNEEADMLAAMMRGVHGIVTDAPHLLAALCGRVATKR